MNLIWYGAPISLGCLLATLLSARREGWKPAERRLLFAFRLAWSEMMVVIAGLIANLALEASGDLLVTAAAAAIPGLAAYGAGWPRLAMPVYERPPPWWSLRRYLSPIRILCCTFFVFSLGSAAEYVFLYGLFERQLPSDLSNLVNYEPLKVTRVLSAEGEVIGEFYLEKRLIVGLDAVPLPVRQAFIAAEDKRFYEHHGIDIWRILIAAKANFEKGDTVQGGSTISQQVVKRLLNAKERSFERKFKEAIMTRRIERALIKDQILELYLNQVYFGDAGHGLAAAAENYFAKKPDQLTLAEAAMLAGLLPAPARYAPSEHYDKARDRQRYVLGRMRQDGFISQAEYEAAKAEPIRLVSNTVSINAAAAPYFVEYVRKYLSTKYGRDGLYRHGLTVRTTLSTTAQQYAELALRRGLDDLDLRLGFRGPVGHFEGIEAECFRANPPSAYAESNIAGVATLAARSGRAYQAMVVSRTPASLQVAIGKELFALAAVDLPRVADWESRFQRQMLPGDVINVRIKEVKMRKGQAEAIERRAFLTQQPTVEAAMIVIEPSSGKLRAMVGGYDFGLSQWNRTCQGKNGRQVGSAIKPFVYAAAIERGKRQTDKIFDGHFSKPKGDGTAWTPRNFDDKYYGPVTIRQALALSLNTVACRLVDEVIGINRTVETMHRLGISSEIPPVESIAIGAVGVHLMELAYAYATFPAGGREVRPVFIEQITDARGRVIFDLASGEQPAPRQRLDPADAYIVLDLMKGVVENGTARRARALGRPTAGKTGTTNDSNDAWFIGFTADLLAGVWVGRDKPSAIGAGVTGGNAALPIWLAFMRNAHPDTPPRDFPVPPGIVFRRGDARTGLPGSAGETALVPYRRGRLPDEP